MNMGMVLILSAPGMEDPEEARQLPSHVLWIFRKFFDSPGRCFKKSAVTYLLVAPDKISDLRRHGEGKHEVMPWKLLLFLSFQPKGCLVMLTAWAVPVSAGHMYDMWLAARSTLIDNGSKPTGFASGNIPNGLFMICRHVGSEAFQIFMCMGFKYIVDNAHVKTPSLRNL
jgi:hypothetical protein